MASQLLKSMMGEPKLSSALTFFIYILEFSPCIVDHSKVVCEN